MKEFITGFISFFEFIEWRHMGEFTAAVVLVAVILAAFFGSVYFLMWAFS